MNMYRSMGNDRPTHLAEWPVPAPVLLLGLVACIIGLILPVTDIGFADETSYLMQGVNFLKDPPLIDRGPLYSFWYFLLNFFVRDHYYLYFTSWCLLVFLSITTPYIIERNQAAIVYAFLACLLPFYNRWPYINLFSAVIVLGSLSIIERELKKSCVAVCLTVLLTCAVISYARPEYEYACFPAAGLLVLAYVFEPKTRGTTVALALGIVVFIAVVWSFAAFSAARSGIAFGTYHDVIAQAHGKLNENPWTSGYSYKLFGLPQSATLLDFLRANPAEFGSHILYNITRPLFIGLVLLLSFTILISCARLTAEGRLVLAPMPLYRAATIVVFYIPALAATGIIFPSTHYLIIPYLVSIYYIARSDLAETLGQRRAAFPVLIVLVAMSLIVECWIESRKDRPYKPTIGCLLQLQRERGIMSGNVLESLGGVYAYLEGDTKRVAHDGIKEGESIPAFLQRVDPVIVLTDDNFFRYMAAHEHTKVASLSEFDELFRQNGYGEYQCRHPGPAIFVRN